MPDGHCGIAYLLSTIAIKTKNIKWFNSHGSVSTSFTFILWSPYCPYSVVYIFIEMIYTGLAHWFVLLHIFWFKKKKTDWQKKNCELIESINFQGYVSKKLDKNWEHSQENRENKWVCELIQNSSYRSNALSPCMVHLYSRTKTMKLMERE